MRRGPAGTGPSRRRWRRRPGTACRPRVANNAAASRAARRAVQPGGRGPQQAGDPQHEAQRQDPRGGQASDAVGERAQGRVEDGCPGEVGREVGDRRLRAATGPTPGARPAGRGPRPGMPCWTRRAAGTGPPARPGRPPAATAPGPPTRAGQARAPPRRAGGADTLPASIGTASAGAGRDSSVSTALSAWAAGSGVPAVTGRSGRSMGTGSCAALTGAAHNPVARPGPLPARKPPPLAGSLRRDS